MRSLFISSTLRVFIALNLPSEIKAALHQETASLRQQIPQNVVRWVVPENLHLTLKFLGDVPTEKLPTIQAALKTALEGYGTLKLHAQGAGCFPNTHRPRVVWIGLGGEVKKLVGLAERIENSLVPVGFDKEKRPFSPHLTLGRVRDGQPSAQLQVIGRAVQKVKAGTLAAWHNDHVHLMQSTLKPSGSDYTVLAEFQLG